MGCLVYCIVLHCKAVECSDKELSRSKRGVWVTSWICPGFNSSYLASSQLGAVICDSSRSREEVVVLYCYFYYYYNCYYYVLLLLLLLTWPHN